MRKYLRASLALIIVVTALGAWACPSGGAKIKPSQQVSLAQGLTTVPVAFRSLGRIADVLAFDGDLPGERSTSLKRALKQALTKLDDAAQKIHDGAWDAATAKQRIRIVADEFEAAVRDGSLGIKNPQSQRRWLDWALLARMVFEDVTRLTDALRPPPQTIQADAERKVIESITASGVVEIVNISTLAALDIKNIRDDTDLESLWQKYQAQSKQAHEALR